MKSMRIMTENEKYREPITYLLHLRLLLPGHDGLGGHDIRKGNVVEKPGSKDILSQCPLLHHETLKAQKLHRHGGVKLAQVIQSLVDQILLADCRVNQFLTYKSCLLYTSPSPRD